MTHEPAFAQEVRNGLEHDALPAYAPMLTALHRAAAIPLQQIVDTLPIRPGDKVLDVACGDGVYAAWLAQHVGDGGKVVGIDIAPAYLELAHQTAQASAYAERIEFHVADIAGLPFPDDEFDLVWCAHSLYSLPDPLAALREMQRVVRPGGTIGILENDTLHHMLLPWPPELELAVRQAQLEVLEAQTQMTGRFYIGRNLCSVFATVGLAECRMATYTIDHRAPLSPDERTYLAGYFDDLHERTLAHLGSAAQQAWKLLFDPNSELYVLDQPDFFASHLEIVAQGIKV